MRPASTLPSRQRAEARQPGFFAGVIIGVLGELQGFLGGFRVWGLKVLGFRSLRAFRVLWGFWGFGVSGFPALQLGWNMGGAPGRTSQGSREEFPEFRGGFEVFGLLGFRVQVSDLGFLI